jgi:protein O-GlcNAc transferase
LQCRQFDDAPARQAIRQRLIDHGIDLERVSLHGASDRAAYLTAHGEVDFILDSFPYTGGTTTCEALWMGVPTLTLAGNSLLSRQGASLLTAAGLADWVADSEDEYIAKAVSFAHNLDALVQLRAALRQQVQASALFDACQFACNLENALWAMWKNKSATGFSGSSNRACCR